MEKGTKTTEKTGEGKMQVYEVGFHVVPALSAAAVAEKAAEFRSLIEKNNGTVISEGAPKNQPLAYTLYKDVGSVRSKYDSAHFGWVKFEAPTTTIAAIKDAMDKDEVVIRHIIIKTVRENTLYTQKTATAHKSESDIEENKSDEKKAEEKPVLATTAPLSLDEIDKTIDKMVTE